MIRQTLRAALNPKSGRAYTIKRPNGEEWMFIVDFVEKGQVYARRFLRHGKMALCKGRFRQRLATWRKGVRIAMKEALR